MNTAEIENEFKEIKYDITVYVPGTVCNMRCEYCYITQCIDENHSLKVNLKYPLETMIRAFSPKRLGGLANVTVIGSGETLFCKEVIPFVKGLLEFGHVVSLVTNVTITKRLDEILNFERKLMRRLIIKGSCHWDELVRLKKLDTYFDYLRKFREVGANISPFLVICSSYYKQFEEIHDRFIKELGDVPDCSPCLIMPTNELIRGAQFYVDPPLDENFLKKEKLLFNSKVFDTCVKWLDIDPQKIFCYAGKWSFIVNLESGRVRKCHRCPSETDFFVDLENMPKLEAIGSNCQTNSCSLQYNFIGEGLIPEYDDEKMSFGKMIYKEKFMNKEVLELLDYKFYKKYPVYSKAEEKVINKDVEILFKTLNSRINAMKK